MVSFFRLQRHSCRSDELQLCTNVSYFFSQLKIYSFLFDKILIVIIYSINDKNFAKSLQNFVESSLGEKLKIKIL